MPRKQHTIKHTIDRLRPGRPERRKLEGPRYKVQPTICSFGRLGGRLSPVGPYISENSRNGATWSSVLGCRVTECAQDSSESQYP